MPFGHGWTNHGLFICCWPNPVELVHDQLFISFYQENGTPTTWPIRNSFNQALHSSSVFPFFIHHFQYSLVEPPIFDRLNHIKPPFFMAGPKTPWSCTSWCAPCTASWFTSSAARLRRWRWRRWRNSCRRPVDAGKWGGLANGRW